MAVSNIPDYKLDGTFLKEFMIEMGEKPSTKVSSIRLPVFVQVIKVFPIRLGGSEWSQLFLSDGQFEMSGCTFLSKQVGPEIFSILKITKIIKLPENLKNNLNSNLSSYRVGEIEFDVEVSGEQIGFRLYKNLKDMNMRDLMKRKREFGWPKTKEALETPYSAYATTIMTHMWENRSEQFCDINFTFEEDEGVVVFAHRSVLVAASEVFRAHSDNQRFIDNKTVHIVDSSFYSFNKLLEFIYTGNVQFTTWKLAFQLLYLSKKYLMPSLENLCQNVITDYCDYDSENPLKVFEENKKVNDEKIQTSVKNYVLSKPYVVIHSISFLNCAFSTVEWIFSLKFLKIDEWSRLCAIYKWAHQNGVNAFCQTIGDESDVDCLHALLEYVHYENIDGLSLQRFLNLPKLPEIVDAIEIKRSIFDQLLENGSYLDTGTKYPKCRSSFYNRPVYAEIEFGSSGEREMKDIQLTDGPLLGFKIKVEKKNLDNGKLSLDIVPTFRYLYSFDICTVKIIQLMKKLI